MSESFSDGGVLSSAPNSPFSPAEEEEDDVEEKDEGGAQSHWDRSISQREGGTWDRSVSRREEEEEQRSPAWDRSVSCPEDTAAEEEQLPQWDRDASWDTQTSEETQRFSKAEQSPQWGRDASWDTQTTDETLRFSNLSSTSLSTKDSTVVIRSEAHTFVVHKDVLMQSGILRDMMPDASSQAEQNDDDFEIRCGEDPKILAVFLGLLYENAADLDQGDEEESTFSRRSLQHDILGQFKAPEITNDNVTALLALSTKYEVPCLLENCEDYLIANPTCPRRQNLARKYSMKRLNASCMLDTLLSDPSNIESKIAGILNGSDEQYSDELIAQLLFRMEEEKVILESENCDLQQQQSEHILENFRIA